MNDLTVYKSLLNEISNKLLEIQHYKDADKPSLGSYLNKSKHAMSRYRDLVYGITTEFISVITKDIDGDNDLAILEELNYISQEADKMFSDLKELVILIKEEL